MGRRVIRPFPSLTYPFPYRYRSQLRPPSFPTYPLPSNLYRLQVPFSTSPSVFCFDTLTSSRAVQGLLSSLIKILLLLPRCTPANRESRAARSHSRRRAFSDRPRVSFSRAVRRALSRATASPSPNSSQATLPVLYTLRCSATTFSWRQNEHRQYLGRRSILFILRARIGPSPPCSVGIC